MHRPPPLAHYSRGTVAHFYFGANTLARVQIAFAGVEDDILRAKTPGYMRMLTMSHRFVIPTQAFRFEARPAAGAPAAAPTQH